MPTRAFSVLSTAETRILNADPHRILAVIQNTDESNPIWLSDAEDKATAHEGLKLWPRGSLTLRYLAGELPDKNWYAISENATVVATVFEVMGPIPQAGGGGNGGGQGGGAGGGSGSQAGSAAALLIAFGIGGALK